MKPRLAPMLGLFTIAWLLAQLISGCSFSTRPPLPPPDGPGDCQTAHDNLARLGGCGVELDRFVADCQAATDAEASLGIRFPAGCISASETCDAAMQCR
jgi:hypothetical protein